MNPQIANPPVATPFFFYLLATIMILGGSTNAVLHLIAMAKSVGVALTQDGEPTTSAWDSLGAAAAKGRWPVERDQAWR